MKAKKVLIAAVSALVVAGLVVVSYTLAGSGALEDLNERYNIFKMVDESLGTMQDMNVVMGEVKNNVNALNGKLDLLRETNDLLQQQLAVVDELNVLMAGQKPSPRFGKTSASKPPRAPPIIRSGVTSQGAKALSSSAAGRRITSLLKSEPFVIFQMIGSSRSGVKPVTYCGVTAVSSMTTPAALVLALPAAAATSSIDDAAIFAMVATSSSSAARPDGMGISLKNWTNAK